MEKLVKQLGNEINNNYAGSTSLQPSLSMLTSLEWEQGNYTVLGSTSILG